jgi:Zn-finger nucleic acid-binding protein
MKCPVDKSVMMVVEHRRIEMDYCTLCSGVWLDSGELELLISVLKADGASLADVEPPSETTGQGKRRCPICGRKMNKVWMGKAPRVLIDSCPQGDGLWFDKGELQKVIHEMELPGTAGSSDVLRFLGESLRATHTHDAKKEITR